MQSTNTPEDKIQTIRRCLALASIGLFSFAAFLVIIVIFKASSTLFRIAEVSVILGITFFGISWNISRIYDKSVAVRILAKVSIVVDLVAAIAISLGVIGVPTNLYKNCSELGSRAHDFTECIENARTFTVIYRKVAYIAIVLALAGEIVGRYLTYETTKKFTNITRWIAVSLTTLSSLAIIISCIFEISLGGFMGNVAGSAFVVGLLTVVVTPILLRVEKEYAKPAALPAQDLITPVSSSDVE